MDVAVDSAVLVGIISVVATGLRVLERVFFERPPVKEPNPSMNEHKAGDMSVAYYDLQFRGLEKAMGRMERSLDDIGDKLDTLIAQGKD